jgi:hypothetical protein
MDTNAGGAMPLFSKRNPTVKDTYDYNIPLRVRHRIFHTLAACLEQNHQTDLGAVFEEVIRRLVREYGSLSGNADRASNAREAAIRHFEACPDEQFMDFLQVCFETPPYCGGPQTVAAINQVLEEENIGFELTEFRETEREPSGPYGVGGYRIVAPSVIKKSEKTLHRSVVQPCLHVLTDPKFNTASDELLRAFAEYRRGDYADAVTGAGAAFETVLKTICTLKRWTYDKDKAACAALVEVCREKGLFYPFYAEIFKNVGTIRNKIGDAHGKGPTPEYQATKELAEHMLYTVCMSIHLLVTLAQS